MTETTLKTRLYAFKHAENRLAELRQSIQEVWCNCGMKALTYDSPILCEDYKYHSATEDTAARNLDMYNDLIKAYGAIECEVFDIKRRLARLCTPEQVIIEEYYFERKSWGEIADMIGKKESYTRKILHGLAIKEMMKE